MYRLKIRDIREDRNYTQKQIAEELNIKQNTYSQIETEKNNIQIDQLIKLSEFYNTSTDYLLGLTNITKPYPRINKKI